MAPVHAGGSEGGTFTFGLLATYRASGTCA
jgi:hypothetical protein